MDEELKACPFCGETLRINNARLAVHSRNSECLLRQQPIVVEDKDQVECWNTRATHPAAASVGGGEAVAVVAYRGKDPDGGEGFVGARWPDAFGEDCIVERLMTVAQHNRIVAAIQPAPAGVVVPPPKELALALRGSMELITIYRDKLIQDCAEPEDVMVADKKLAELRALLNQAGGE